MANKNKHGLGRHIPKAVRALVRKNSGYGCVICGNAIVEYEHVDPEFHEAKIHNASCMALLCPTCHSKVTKGAMSKSLVKEAMKNPWSFQHGLSYDDLELPPSDPKMYIGNSVYNTENVLLRARGKDLIKFHPPEVANTPFRISAEFYNELGVLTSRIRKNVFESILGDHDIEFVGTKITIKTPGSNKPSLVVERVGGENLRILELNMFYQGILFNVENTGVLTVKMGQSTIVISKSEFSGCGTVFNFN